MLVVYLPAPAPPAAPPPAAAATLSVHQSVSDTFGVQHCGRAGALSRAQQSQRSCHILNEASQSLPASLPPSSALLQCLLPCSSEMSTVWSPKTISEHNRGRRRQGGGHRQSLVGCCLYLKRASQKRRRRRRQKAYAKVIPPLSGRAHSRQGGREGYQADRRRATTMPLI